jgi:2-oxoglutarate ferredoxin oxidoreductase subunit beta
MLPLKQMIKKSFEHKGFSVVEVISNCHINLGRRNKMKDPLTMDRWIASKTVSKAEYEKLPLEERENKYSVGLLYEDKQRLEYSELYYNHLVPTAKEAAAKKNTEEK